MRELNFFEAMKAADEGKVVVSCGGKYKKYFRKLLRWFAADNIWMASSLSGIEIDDPWTIEEPEPKLPIKFECFGSGNYYTDEHKRIDQIIDIVADLQKQIKELKGER